MTGSTFLFATGIENSYPAINGGRTYIETSTRPGERTNIWSTTGARFRQPRASGYSCRSSLRVISINRLINVHASP